MERGLTTGMKVALGIEIAIALLFFMFAWGESYRNSVGRGPAPLDILGISIPLILVTAAIFLARAAARNGNDGRAWAIIFLPFPISIVLAMLSGAV